MFQNSIRCFTLIVLIIFEMCLSQPLVSPMNLNESDPMPRVVNGVPAALGDVPYLVSFKRPIDRIMSSFMTFCGGVIIGSTKLLTAAHCFGSKKAKSCKKSMSKSSQELVKYRAVAGTLLNQEVYRTDDNPSGAQWRRLRSVIYPCSFKFPLNDIAVVMTILPYNFNAHIGSIPYARRFKDYKGECLVSGYGRTSMRYKKISPKLLIARLEVLPLNWCSQKHHKNMSKFVCTVQKVTDVAQGDSGGPLVCSDTGDSEEGPNGLLVGIVSGHRYGSGSFFTRVSAFSDYIRRNEANSFRARIRILVLIYGEAGRSKRVLYGLATHGVDQ